MSLEEALKVVKLAGFRVSKPKAPRKKDRVGPTFVARFADGQVTRMSCYCVSDEKLDWERGERLSIAAHISRRHTQPKQQYMRLLANPMMERHHETIRELLLTRPEREQDTPAILECWFERDGVQLGSPQRQAA